MTLITSTEQENGRASRALRGDERMQRQEARAQAATQQQKPVEAERTGYSPQVADIPEAEDLLTVIAQIIARLLGTETDVEQMEGLQAA
jgi:hypothetical protein